MGTQREGSTLVAVSSSVVEFMQQWQEATGGSVDLESVALPTGASLGPSASTGPEIALSLSDPSGRAQRWILRETWWGGIVTPPKFRSMLRWSLTLLIRSELQIMRPI